MPDPVVQRNILKLARREHFQKDRIRIASVLDVMARNPRHKTDVVRVEVHRVRPVAIKHCHAPLTGNPVLPFRSVGMPMQFAQTTRLNGDLGRSNVGETGRNALYLA